LPHGFEEKVKEIYIVKALNQKELQRRKRAFMYLWRQLSPRIEKEVGMSIKEMDKLA